MTSELPQLEIYRPKETSKHNGKLLLLLVPATKKDKEKPLHWRYGFSVRFKNGGVVQQEQVSSDYIEKHFQFERIL